jgi:hypothetical protein
MVRGLGLITVCAGMALLASGAHLVFSWRGFWLPLAGGLVWTAGNYCVPLPDLAGRRA